MSAVAIGIDLGTSFSCVAAIHNGNIEIIHNEAGNRITPSEVTYAPDLTYVGEGAHDRRSTMYKNTIYQTKRFMGKKYDDKSIMEKNWPFEVLADEHRRVQFRVNERILTPEQVSADILKHMKKHADTFIGKPMKDAVITVPAYFNNEAREATKQAGIIAGLNVLRIVNEPTAAAIAYGYKLRDNNERIILVYDLGGGTFDVSIVRMVGLDVQVLATEGNMDLGGENFNDRIFDELATRFTNNNQDVSRWDLLLSTEQAKKQLSTQTVATVSSRQKDGNLAHTEITRELFDELCEDLFQDTISIVEKALRLSKIGKNDLDDIVLVGGSTRIPRVRQLLQQFFPNQSLKCDIHPDEAVAFGAAILANSIAGGDAPHVVVKLTDVTPLSIGVEVAGGLMCVSIPKGTRIPHSDKGFFNNPRDNMNCITFNIYEGERKVAKENHHLGEVSIRVPQMKAGQNNLEAIFTIDSNGLLKVTANDVHTGQSAVVTLSTGRLTKDQVEKMVREARDNEKKDEQELNRRLARSLYCDSISRIRRLANNSRDDVDKRMSLLRIVAREEEWLKISQNVPERIYRERMNMLPSAATRRN